MTITRRAILAGFVVAATASAFVLLPSAPGPAANNLPDRLSDQEFWRVVSTFSEPGGSFHSDNFVSNETEFQTVIPELVERVGAGGLYIGVGPEQNFTYLAAIRPKMAFIVDIRRGNLHAHLLYKALFEMSADRADFLARLFVRDRPALLGPSSTVAELFAGIASTPATEARYQASLAAVVERLTRRRGFPLGQADLDGIAYVYRSAFFADGPELNYRLTGQGGSGRRGGRGTPTYAELMTTDDDEGRQRSYLASEANFAFVKDLHEKNLIVPVVGDFGGAHALRAVGRYAREHDAVVSVLYASNVEQYLRPDGKWDAFCANVAAMPLDATSTFIRSVRGGGGGGFSRFRSSLGSMQAETRGCASRRAAHESPSVGTRGAPRS